MLDQALRVEAVEEREPEVAPLNGDRRSAAARSRHRICAVVGTRPEVIKLAPVLRELAARADRVELTVVSTSQQDDLLAEAWAGFGLRPHADLALSGANRDPGTFTAEVLLALTRRFRSARPDLVLVQGDTSTAAGGALAAFYLGIPIGHVEAGLRSGDLGHPFPEEGNRRLAGAVASLHFAPTEGARENLLREGARPRDVYVTGNTVVDALRATPRAARFQCAALDLVNWGSRRVLLATVHRRENLGAPLRSVCSALRRLAAREGVEVVVPVHPNPEVKRVLGAELSGVPGVTVVPPLSYRDLLEVLRRCHLVLTDSGGLQEEAPSFGKPVLILRETTERPEVLASGFGRLVGTEPSRVVAAAAELLDDPGAYARATAGESPFGDGRAASRIVEILLERLGQRAAVSGQGGR